MSAFDFASVRRSLVSVVGALMVATVFVGAAVAPAHVTTRSAQAL